MPSFLVVMFERTNFHGLQQTSQWAILFIYSRYRSEQLFNNKLNFMDKLTLATCVATFDFSAPRRTAPGNGLLLLACLLSWKWFLKWKSIFRLEASSCSCYHENLIWIQSTQFKVFFMTFHSKICLIFQKQINNLLSIIGIPIYFRWSPNYVTNLLFYGSKS